MKDPVLLGKLDEYERQAERVLDNEACLGADMLAGIVIDLIRLIKEL